MAFLSSVTFGESSWNRCCMFREFREYKEFREFKEYREYKTNVCWFLNLRNDGVI